MRELCGFTVQGGRAVDAKGHVVPSLADPRAPIGAWREVVGDRKPPFYVRFDDRALPFNDVQRLARLGDLWVDAPVQGPEDVLDLAIAASGRIVLWTHKVPADGMEEWWGDAHESGVVAVDAARGGPAVTEAEALARRLAMPLLLAGRTTHELQGLDAFRLEAGDGPFAWRLPQIAEAPAEAPGATSESDTDGEE